MLGSRRARSSDVNRADSGRSRRHERRRPVHRNGSARSGRARTIEQGQRQMERGRALSGRRGGRGMILSFILSNFGGKTDNKPAPTTYTWEDFLARLPAPAIRANKDGALYAGASFEPARRLKANVKEVSVLALDDDGAALDATVEKWKRLGVTSAWYTTHSHQRVKNPGEKSEKPPCDRYRVVIPLDGAIPAVYYPALWRWAERQADGVVADENTKDCSRMSYWPAKASAEAVYAFGSHEGRLLDWREIPEIKYAIKAFESECAKLKATATNGEKRHDQLFKSAAALGELVAGGVLC